ncbi:porin [Bacterioplanoides sp.]|uniref:porin n=1 Tax=Bacterioplanoides sp. TaxID=2066072 RepID=UPI003AFFA013
MSYKTPLAIAVAAAALSSTAAAVPSVNFYGFVDIGLETYSDSTSNGTDVYPNGGSDDPNNSSNRNTDDRQFALANGVQSRLGVMGEEELDDGWVGSYRIEARINVLDDGGAFARTRLGWFGLSKGEHSIKVGAQWSPYFEYSAWNTHRSEVQGVGSYFYITSLMPGSVGFGYRNDSTINYTYGGGGFSDSPFTATIALHIAEDDREITVGAQPLETESGEAIVVDGEPLTQGGKKELVNDSGITAVTVGTAATFGGLTLNASAIQSVVIESDAAKDADLDVAEPMIYSLGAKYVVNDQLDFGFAYRGADRDTGDDDFRHSSTIALTYKPVSKLVLNFGYANGKDEDKTERQLDNNYFGSAYYQLSGERLAGFEFEEADYGSDGKTQAFLFSLRQSF